MSAGPVLLIAAREVTTRLQQRGYRVGLGIGVLVVVVAVALPGILSGKDEPSRYDVGLAVDRPALERVLAGGPVDVHRASPAVAEQKVRSGAWDAAVVPGDRLLAGHSGDAVVGVVQAAYRTATSLERLQGAGLSASAARRALTVQPLAVHTTADKDKDQRSAIAVLAILLLFSQLVTFCTWAAMGVVEEKSSRVVELILASVRPLQLLAGKLLGIGVLATGQVLALGLAALASASAAGSLTVPASAIGTLVVGFVAFLFGYAFFGALAAALGSTVSRQEEVSGVLAPVTVTLMVCYGAGFSAVNSPDSTLSRVLSVVPPVSVIGLPARVARGSAPVGDVVLAAVLLVLATAGVLVVAARIYRASVLHSGTRVPLGRAWRGEPAAG
jgi:ABC-2 type transport system permease protein